jgi:hypothetical protein
MKRILKLIFSSLFLFGILTFLTVKYERVRDGSDYYGYPWTFYEINDYPGGHSLNSGHLIFDLFFSFIFVFLVSLLNKYVLITFFRNLYRLPPKFWGFTYLLLIPTYALLFFLLPNQFYNNSYKIEKLSQGSYPKESYLRFEINNGIGEAMVKNFKEHYHCNYIITNKGDTLFDPIGYYTSEAPVEIEGSNLIITILIPLKDRYDGVLYLKMPLTNDYDDYSNSRVLTLDTLRTFQSQDSAIFNFDIERLFPYGDGKHKNFPTGGNMRILIDPKLQIKINSFAFGLNGISRDDFWNMFYLSTVTITTLGFGDIVPITKTSRLLVSSESILGIIIIGLFLNALSKNLLLKKTNTN